MNKILKMFCLSLAIILLLSFGAYAAVQEWTAVQPSYSVYVNGDKIEGNDVVTLKDNNRTYIQPTALEKYGVQRNWDAATRTATFTIPQVAQPNEGNLNSLSDLAKAGVMIYSNGQFKGNGLFYEGKYIIIPESVWSFGNIVCKDYKNRVIPLKTIPVVANSKFVQIETNGYTSKYNVKLADKNETVGNDVFLISSITGTQNQINLSTIADYKQFNSILAPQDGVYLRTYNNCSVTQLGGGLYNNNGELVGVFIAKGPNYALFDTVESLNSFLD